MAAIFPGAVATQAQLWTAVNGISTTLNGAVDNLVVTLNVVDTTSFPATGYVVIDSEIISYTGKTGTSFTGCTRGADGSTAASHTTASTVSALAVADHHNILTLEIRAIELDIQARLGIGASSNAIAVPSGVSFTIASTAGLSITSGALTVTPTSNQIVLGATRTVTITAPTPASLSRVWTIPDISAAGTFAALEGTQTFSGTKTFSALIKASDQGSGPSLSGTTSTTSGIGITSGGEVDIWSGGAIQFFTDNGLRLATSRVIKITDGALGAGSIQFISDATTGIYTALGGQLAISSGGSRSASFFNTNVRIGVSPWELSGTSTAWSPATSNSLSCGASGSVWTAVWATNGTIQTSFSDFKTDIHDIVDPIIPRGVFYRWKDKIGTEEDRTWAGFIADPLQKECFAWGKDGEIDKHGVNLGSVVGNLCAGWHLHQGILERLETRVSALEQKQAA